MLKCTAAMCSVVPVPDEATVYLPGLALSSAMKDLRSFAGTDGCAATISGVLLMIATAVKSSCA